MRFNAVLMLLLSLCLFPGQAHCENSLRDLFARVSPAVCVLQTVGNEVSATAESGLTSARGLGSGVLISDDGLVLTAAHVVHLADAVAAEFGNERIPAKVLGTVPPADVALIRLDRMPSGVTPAILGNSDLAVVGDRVMIIGAPFGLSRTLSAGYLSGRHDLSEQLESMVDIEILQSDAAANTGNSGGPMFNMNGEVIGIISSILTRSGGFDGISNAISAKTARQLLLEDRPHWSGLDVILLNKYAAAFNVPQEAGLLVQRVAQGSIADRLGIMGGSKVVTIEQREILIGGDIILEAAGIKIDASPDALKKIRTIMQNKKRGDRLQVKVLRAGVVKALSAKIP